MSLRLRRILCLSATAAVAMGVSVGLAAPAFAEEVQPPARDQVDVDILGDSYNSGEGMRGTYFDPEDRRHRSPFASGSQALQRLQDANPDVDIDGQIGASSGATTRDVFEPQTDDDGNVINPPQGSLVRPGADAVVMGFGGNDALFADVLTEAWHSVSNGQSSPRFDEFMAGLAPLMDTTLTPEEYARQAESTPGGQAPTIVARMLQAMREIQAKAPGAKLVVPNYPLPVDPQATSFWSRFSEYELQRFREFGTRLNQAIAKSVEICGCATLADMAGALDGREAYTDDPAINDLNAALTGRYDQWNSMEPFHPNVQGGGLMSDAIARALAEALEMKSPEPGGANPTPFDELREAPDPEGFEPVTRGRTEDDEDTPDTDDDPDGKKADSDAKGDGKGKGDDEGKGDGSDELGTETPGTGTENPGTTDPGTGTGTENPGTTDPGTTDPSTPSDDTPTTGADPAPTPISATPEQPPTSDNPSTPPHDGGDGGDPAPSTPPAEPAPPTDTAPPADSTPPADSNDDGNPFDGGGSDSETPANSSGSPDDRDENSDDSPGFSFGGGDGGSDDPSPDSDGLGAGTDGSSPDNGGAPANSSGSPDDRDGTSGDTPGGGFGDSFGGGSYDSGNDSSNHDTGTPANSSGSPDDRDGTSGDTPGGGYGGDDGSSYGGDDSGSYDSGNDSSNHDTGAPANSSGSPDDRDGTSGDTPGGGYSDSYGDGDGSCACW